MLRSNGMTLTEVLIALAVLAVVAAFTIPKVLQTTQQSSQMAVLRETMSMISQAYMLYKQDNMVTANTTWQDLLPYMNTLGVDRTSIIDNRPNGASNIDCSGTTLPITCIRLHNGGVFYFWTQSRFNGTTPEHLLMLVLDPDGRFNSGSDDSGPGKAVQLNFYYDGTFRSVGNSKPNSATYLTPSLVYGPPPLTNPYPIQPTWDPSWLKW